MWENSRIDINNELYIESFNTGSIWSFIIKVFPFGEEPFQVFSMDAESPRNYNFFPKAGFLEIFANILRAGGLEQLKSSNPKFGEIETSYRWKEIYYSNHKEFSEVEKAYLQVIRPIKEFSSSYDFPTKKVSKTIHSHVRNFQKNPPRTVEDAIKFASPTLMRYGEEFYDLMTLFKNSGKTNLLNTAKSRKFYHKIYAMALTGEEMEDHLFGDWEPPAANELQFKNGVFTFIENFSLQNDFVEYLDGLTFGEIKTLGASPVFINRKKSLLPTEIIEVSKLAITGKKSKAVNKDLIAVEAFASLIRAFDSNVGDGSAGHPPEDSVRRNAVRGGPHIYVELMELFIMQKDKYSILQSIQEYCDSGSFTVKTYLELWDFVLLLLRGNAKLWLKNASQSESVIKTMKEEIGGVASISLILEANYSVNPLNAKQWGKVTEQYKLMGDDVPFDWLVSMS